MNNVIYSDTITLTTDSLVPHQITFFSGNTWALKITKDSIISNPEIPTDEGAKAMFRCLEGYIRSLK